MVWAVLLVAARDGGVDLSGGSGSFVRRFRLPENAKINQMKAAMEDGVLAVTVPYLHAM